VAAEEVEVVEEVVAGGAVVPPDDAEELPPPHPAIISSDAAAKAIPSCLTGFMAIPSELADTAEQAGSPLYQNGLVPVHGKNIGGDRSAGARVK